MAIGVAVTTTCGAGTEAAIDGQLVVPQPDNWWIATAWMIATMTTETIAARGLHIGG